MTLDILVVIGVAMTAGILYRMGGAHGYNTKFRDLGIPVLGIATLLWIGRASHYSVSVLLSHIITFGIMFASQTTYFKKKGSEARWWNWALVGLANGLALLPYAITTGLWGEFIARTVICIALITAWSQLMTNVVWEEIGRGVVIILSLLAFWKRKR